MSNNKKFKNDSQKGIIPKSMKGMVFNSLSALGAAFGCEAPEPKPRGRACRKCGAPMHNPEGTNVWLCTGVNEDGKACNNRLFSGVKAV